MSLFENTAKLYIFFYNNLNSILFFLKDVKKK